jgi:hypothetical protein
MEVISLDSTPPAQNPMDQKLHAFQELVKEKWTRVPFAIRLLRCLQFVAANPCYVSIVGVVAAHYKAILFDVRVLARFLELIPNGLNKNLRQHGFEMDTKADIVAELERCAPAFHWTTKAKTWSKRVCREGAFHPGTTDAEAYEWAARAACMRHGRRYVPCNSEWNEKPQTRNVLSIRSLFEQFPDSCQSFSENDDSDDALYFPD